MLQYMSIGLIFILILFCFLFYFLIQDDTEKVKENVKIPHRKKQLLEHPEDAYVKIVDSNGRYLNTTSDKGFKLSKTSEEFQIVKLDKNKVGIKSPKSGDFLMIQYSPLYNTSYKVVTGQTILKNNSVALKLSFKEKVNMYYIKFFNDHYLCFDDEKVFSSKDKTKIFYFTFLR